ncbi:hypothetical protein F5Y10DRAFT_270556 [Nemania abortiva]|nr:hypothetical protein F5Y10DRAFT_270556 [Nemania abortiva]
MAENAVERLKREIENLSQDEFGELMRTLQERKIVDVRVLQLTSSSRSYQYLPSTQQFKKPGIIEKTLAGMPDVWLTGLGRPQVQTVGWYLTKTIVPPRLEALLTEDTRKLVDHTLVMAGKRYSGVFRLVSVFEVPGQFRLRMTGTAFAFSRFHAGTSAHNLFHPKLGPAKKVALYPDEREAANEQRNFRECVAAVCQAEWVKSSQDQTDFGILTVTEAFGPGVRVLPYETPEPFQKKNGLILGFPTDLPFVAGGKQLVESEGVECSYDGPPKGIIEHRINTEKGSKETISLRNSGGPVLVNGKVVGVHKGFMDRKGMNCAVPLNHNGNDVEKFCKIADSLRFKLKRGGPSCVCESRVDVCEQIVYCYR